MCTVLRIVTEPAVSLKLHRSLVQCFIAKYIFWLLFHVLCFVIIFVMYIIVIHWSACLMCTLEHHHHHPWMDMPKLNVETEELPQCYCYTVYPPKHIIAHSMALKLALKWLSIVSLQSFSTLSASQDWDFPMQCILFVRWIILFWLLWEKKPPLFTCLYVLLLQASS